MHHESYKHNYRLVLTYYTFRILLAMVLFAISLVDLQVNLIGEYQSIAFITVVGAYFAMALSIQLYTLTQTHPPRKLSLFSVIITDVIFCLLCLHLSGGFSTGLAILLLLPVAIAGIFFSGILAFFIAAISSIGILLYIAWISLQMPEQAKYFVPAGLLGTLFFACSFIAQFLARYIRSTEILADEKEELAKKLAQTNQLIVQRMQTGVIALDEQLRIHSINSSAQQLLGHNYQIGDQLQGYLRLMVLQRQQNPEFRLKPFQEKPGLAQLRVSFSQNQASDLIVFLENQSLLTQQAQHLKLASLGRLSASIAHEIRNPLSTINHASQLLAEDSSISAANQRLLQMIVKQSTRINDIITSVLNISRRAPAKIELIELAPLIEKTVQQIEQNRALSITLDLHVEPRQCVPFDEGQLQQVLFNLLDNSVAHGKQQAPAITAVAKTSDAKVCLAIYDNGPGIAPDDVEKVFEPFYTTSTQGTGLGLYICRELCEMNQALLDYVFDEDQQGCFQIHFAHNQRQLNFE